MEIGYTLYLYYCGWLFLLRTASEETAFRGEQQHNGQKILPPNLRPIPLTPQPRPTKLRLQIARNPLHPRHQRIPPKIPLILPDPVRPHPDLSLECPAKIAEKKKYDQGGT